MNVSTPPQFPVIVHHNPQCGTSRTTLAYVRAAGLEPTIIEYLKTGWTRPQLLALFAAAGISARDALRKARSPAAELGLLDAAVSDDALIEAMIAHPELVERPIVATPKGVAMCRPAERVFRLLDRLPPGPFAKEDGTVLIDAKGKLVAR